MSNVPDLDDEDSILEEKIDAFREQLGFKREPMIVHRYDSLSLLSQVVFTKDRPRSRLAKEYIALVEEIVRHNLKDRDGALEYVERLLRRRRRYELEPGLRLSMEQRIEQIEKDHFERRRSPVQPRHASRGQSGSREGAFAVQPGSRSRI